MPSDTNRSMSLWTLVPIAALISGGLGLAMPSEIDPTWWFLTPLVGWVMFAFTGGFCAACIGAASDASDGQPFVRVLAARTGWALLAAALAGSACLFLGYLSNLAVPVFWLRFLLLCIMLLIFLLLVLSSGTAAAGKLRPLPAFLQSVRLLKHGTAWGLVLGAPLLLVIFHFALGNPLEFAQAFVRATVFAVFASATARFVWRKTSGTEEPKRPLDFDKWVGEPARALFVGWGVAMVYECLSVVLPLSFSIWIPLFPDVHRALRPNLPLSVGMLIVDLVVLSAIVLLCRCRIHTVLLSTIAFLAFLHAFRVQSIQYHLLGFAVYCCLALICFAVCRILRRPVSAESGESALPKPSWPFYSVLALLAFGSVIGCNHYLRLHAAERIVVLWPSGTSQDFDICNWGPAPVNNALMTINGRWQKNLGRMGSGHGFGLHKQDFEDPKTGEPMPADERIITISVTCDEGEYHERNPNLDKEPEAPAQKAGDR